MTEICIGGPVSEWFPDFGNYWKNFGEPNLLNKQYPREPFSPIFAIIPPDLTTYVNVGHKQPDADLMDWFSSFFGNLYLNIIGYLVDILDSIGIPFPWPEIPGIGISLKSIFDGNLSKELEKESVKKKLDALYPELSTPVKTGKDAYKKLVLLISDTISKMQNSLIAIPALIIEVLIGPLTSPAKDTIEASLKGILAGFQFPTIPTMDSILAYMKSAKIPYTCEGLDKCLGSVGLGFDLSTFGIPCGEGSTNVGSFSFINALTSFMAMIGSLVLKIFTEIWEAFSKVAGIGIPLPELQIPKFCITLPGPVRIN